jgi:hypothetical protein
MKKTEFHNVYCVFSSMIVHDKCISVFSICRCYQGYPLAEKNLVLQNSTTKLVGVVYKIPATDFPIVSTTRKLIWASVTITLDVVDTSQERKVANISVYFRKIWICEIAIIDDGEERIYFKNPESKFLWHCPFGRGWAVLFEYRHFSFIIARLFSCFSLLSPL